MLRAFMIKLILLAMQYTSPRRIFRKGEQARKKHLQQEEEFKVSRYSQFTTPRQQLSVEKQVSYKRYSASERFRPKRNLSLNRHCESRELQSNDSNSLKLSSFDKVAQVEYKVKPILAQRPSFLVRYRKIYKSYQE